MELRLVIDELFDRTDSFELDGLPVASAGLKSGYEVLPVHVLGGRMTTPQTKTADFDPLAEEFCQEVTGDVRRVAVAGLHAMMVVPGGHEDDGLAVCGAEHSLGVARDQRAAREAPR